MLKVNEGYIRCREEFDQCVAAFTTSPHLQSTPALLNLEPETMNDLLEIAEDFAHNWMQKNNRVPLALFYVGQDQSGVFVPRPPCDPAQADHELWDNMRLMAIRQAAISCVTLRAIKFQSEYYDSSFGRTSYHLQMYGESCNGMVLSCMTTTCDTTGGYLGLGQSDVRVINETEHVFRMLPRNAPSALVRAAASATLIARHAIESDLISPVQAANCP